MAKIKKDIKKAKNKYIGQKSLELDIKGQKISTWFENKIARIRSFTKPYAARLVRPGTLLLTSLLFFLAFYPYFLPKNRFEKARENLIKNSDNFEAHLILAEEFLNNHQLDKAGKELVFARNILQNNNKQDSKIAINDQSVLGSSTLLDEIWTRWRLENPEEIKKDINKWEGFVLENPTYRDGYLQLTLLYFKLGEKEKAQEKLQKAIDLDPNNEEIRGIGKQIK